MEKRENNEKCVIEEVTAVRAVSSLRRGIGLKRSSSEKVRAAEPCWGWGLLRLKRDGFLIPNLPKMDFGAFGVVSFAKGAPVCIAALPDAPATWSCSRREM